MIVDANGIQSLGRTEEVLGLEPLADKFRAFGWTVHDVDGHDHRSLLDSLGSIPSSAGRPTCVVARTTKGKGVEFMEDSLAWHYRSPDPDAVADILSRIRGT